MSSLDSVLLVIASVFYKDLFAPVLRQGAATEHGVGVTRVFVVLFALLAAGLALRPPAGIVEITTFSGSLYAVCFLPPVLLGLYWRRGDAVCVLFAMMIGVSVRLLWLVAGFSQWLHEVFPALLASLGTYVVLAQQRRAKPPPGFEALTP